MSGIENAWEINMKRNDWILILTVLLTAGIFAAIHVLRPQEETAAVQVTVNGDIYGTWQLDADQIVEIEDTNRLEIKDGKASMIWADCPDKLCVHQKAVSRTGESIICLPNKVVVTVNGGEEPELDAVVK